MAVIEAYAHINNPQATLQNYTCIKFKRSTTGNQGPWIEITTPTTRPSIAQDQTLYTFTDATGDPSYWYTSSYYNPATQAESNLADPIQGTGDPALNIVSVEMVKNYYLFGLDLTNPDEVEMPDDLFEYYIKSAVSWVERQLGVPLRPKSIMDERHPFYSSNARRYLYTKLDNQPVQSVQRVRLVWPGVPESQVVPLPADWVRCNCKDGSFEVVPGGAYTTSQAIIGPADYAWAGLTGSGFYSYMNSDYIPEVIRVDYLSGFPNGQVPQEVVELCAKVSSAGPLNLAGDLIGGAGIASQSSSIDGLSESINTTSSPMYAGYGARLGIYDKEIQTQVPILRRAFHGVQMLAM